MVLCVDEKSGIQALERTQPLLPLGLGYVEGVTHDYRRHGTTTLFAALDTANGKVLAQCRPRHRHQEYLSFLREIEKSVPKNLEAHIIVGIITPRISIAEFGAGSPRDHDFMCTLLPPMPPGSIRWRSGSIASRSKPYAGEPSAA